jgi:hypothetical protein
MRKSQISVRTAMALPLFSMFLLFAPLFLYGQSWSGILDPARAIDWTNAGIPGGIPSGTWANCVTTACNTLNSGTVTAASINAALNSAPNNTVVRVPAGSFTIGSSVASNRGHVVLRGAGPTQTTITLGSGTNIFFGAAGTGGLGGEPGITATNWTGGLTKGSTVLTVASSSGMSVGQQLVLDQLNNTNLVFTAGSDGTTGSAGRNGTSSFDGSVARAQFQMVEITNISGTQITVNPPVDYTHSTALSPQVFFWSPANPQYVGLENIKVNANSQNFAVAFRFCSYCWAKNIEVDNVARTAVNFYYVYRGEARDSYISGANAAGGPTNYGFELNSCTLVKIENNVVFGITSGILPDTSSGIVLGYNYALNTSSGNEFGDFEPHAVHNYYHLYEGNVVDSLNIDNVWGSHSQTTLLRNRSSGRGQNKTNYRIPLSIEAHNRYLNVIGNVLGTVGGGQVRYQVDNTNEGGSDNFIYQIGFWNRWESGFTDPYDSVVESGLMRWANWDAVPNGVRYCSPSDPSFASAPCNNVSEVPTADPTFPNPAPASRTVPNSFYLFGKPAWFGNVIWPPIGPDVSCSTNCVANAANHAAMIPAQVCYVNGAKDTKGYLTAFDAKVCYSSGSSSAPAPPTNLFASVQ